MRNVTLPEGECRLVAGVRKNLELRKVPGRRRKLKNRVREQKKNHVLPSRWIVNKETSKLVVTRSGDGIVLIRREERTCFYDARRNGGNVCFVMFFCC